MRTTFKSALLAAALALTAAVPACRAQRTAERSCFLTLSPGITAGGAPSVSGEVSFGQYLLRSYWSASVKASHWNHLLTPDGAERFDHLAWHAGAGLMYRLAGTYGRMFSLYVGGRVFLGVAQYQAVRRAPTHWTLDVPTARFIYGAEPAVELELFLGQRAALVCGGHCPLTFGHPDILRGEWWNLTASLGVRYNF